MVDTPAASPAGKGAAIVVQVALVAGMVLWRQQIEREEDVEALKDLRRQHGQVGRYTDGERSEHEGGESGERLGGGGR